MRRPTRLVLSSIAAISLVVAGFGGGGVQSASAALSPGTEVMPTFHGFNPRAARTRTFRTNNLLSSGGAVQVTPKVYISWWGSEWSGTGFTTGGYSGAQAQTYNLGFFGNVGGSSWNNVVKQYCQNVPKGTQICTAVSGAAYITNPTGQLAGAWNDPAPVPANPTQNDIAAAAIRLQRQFGAVDPNATYMVYTPSGKSMSGFGTQWCAWHSWTTTGGQQLAYAYIPYVPDAGLACGAYFVNKSHSAYGNGWFDGFSVVAGHEYSEAETDPFPSSGWIDRNGAENADKCAWSSSSKNITLGTQQYAVQPTWSNASSGCATSAP